MAEPLNLLADIGGTNTRVALADGAVLRPASVRRYVNAAHPDLGHVLRAYQSDTGVSDVDGACAAVAGPVRGGTARMTNLDWTIDAATLAADVRAEVVAILNDLQAQAHALGHLAAENLRRIAPSAAGAGPGGDVGDAARLVVGVGTGFNAAPVHQTAAGRVVPPSECGHVSLPVWDEASARVAAAIRDSHGFAAVEEVLSGRGLANLHAALTGRARSAADIMAALGRSDPAAEATVRHFVRTLGCVVGDLALIHLPFGGIALSGGVARAMAPYLDGFDFAAALMDKGRFGPLLGQIGVAVIEDDYAALTGCAAHLTGLARG